MLCFRLDHRVLQLLDERLQVDAQIAHRRTRSEIRSKVWLRLLGEVVLVEVSRSLGTLLDYHLLELEQEQAFEEESEPLVEPFCRNLKLCVNDLLADGRDVGDGLSSRCRRAILATLGQTCRHLRDELKDRVLAKREREELARWLSQLPL